MESWASVEAAAGRTAEARSHFELARTYLQEALHYSPNDPRIIPVLEQIQQEMARLGR